VSDGPWEALDTAAQRAIEAVLDQLESDREAPTTVADRPTAMRVHVLDSLAGLEFAELREAERICDLGAGAGFPGLVLAAALPETQVVLLEATGRKCEFMRRAIERSALPNAQVVCDRAELFAQGDGTGGFDVVTARAVARLSTLAELASPLLREGGWLLAWKGKRNPDEEAELERAAEALAMRPADVRWSGPYAGSEHRHLHLIHKAGPTPDGIPRRPGMAKKRPRGAL
jgi:16S rRNA (guanine527-N7)-methyltransferase